MSNYQTVRSAAVELSVSDRLRLIDELAASVPDDHPPSLSDEWLAEIDRRSAEIDAHFKSSIGVTMKRFT